LMRKNVADNSNEYKTTRYIMIYAEEEI
jgi:hypothetical protein